MLKVLPLILLLVVAAAQLAVPAGMIARHEAARTEGVPLKFRTGIRDPYDPFRGRYVRLRFELERPPEPFKLASPLSGDGGRFAYVLFEADAEGFARVKAVTTEKPANGPYLYLAYWGDAEAISGFDLPFDRYFMNEKAAPEAERLYSEAIRASGSGRDSPWSNDNYVLVRILDGTAALEELVVDGQPIEQLLENPSSMSAATDS